MRFAKIISAQHHLLHARLISVEVDLSPGLHAFSVVGLPDKAVEESRDRVSAAIKNSGYKSPKQRNVKAVVSLAPAHTRKEGSSFDLPMALGYLLATGDASFDPERRMFVGELSLDGSLRPIRGALSFARLAQREGVRELFVPSENVAEAALVSEITVYGADRLRDVVDHLEGVRDLARGARQNRPATTSSEDQTDDALDLIAGNETGKRAVLIAAAGGHNIALYGPPGTGKTLLARALGTLLPDLAFDESLEVTEIHSIAGTLEGSLVARPPIRTPHHTATRLSVIGGGASPRPGEATLAHRGVLFLDELPEFDRDVIDALRQPLEEGVVPLSRARGGTAFPADFMLVAAMNPCPCGNRGIAGKACGCSARDIERYERKISGPIADRIDLWVEVSRVEHDKLLSRPHAPNNAEKARITVARARALQNKRFARLGIAARTNARVPAKHLARAAMLSPDAESTLNAAARIHDLSARGYHRAVRVARTIADLASSETIEAPHILEALHYRRRMRKTE